MKTFKTLFFLLMLLSSYTLRAAEPLTVDLWPGAPAVKSSDAADTARVYIFLPAAHATGRAILICPGGGYVGLAMEHEGTMWAQFYNSMGIAAIVLKYRMPHGNKNVPISDAEQAMRLIRANAAAWNINPDDIGIMGSSAGGHLASTVATHAKDDVRPNFQILFYPVITMDPEFTHMGSHDNFLGQKAKKKDEVEYSNDLQVSRTTPRALILLSDDDGLVVPANGVNYYFALYKHDIPASLMVYPTGGHGWGMSTDFAFHLEMLMNVRAWLNSF
ncbi:MAG: alpha/beta hydrolase [Prevotella sp.]|nr:alpha/beta hydrolase [Prevotella sp.]